VPSSEPGSGHNDYKYDTFFGLQWCYGFMNFLENSPNDFRSGSAIQQHIDFPLTCEKFEIIKGPLTLN
jgi:hypothetical protein